MHMREKLCCKEKCKRKIIDQKTLLSREREKREGKLFIFRKFLSLTGDDWRWEGRIFSSDLLALHEMQVVIKFKGGIERQASIFLKRMKRKVFSFVKVNYHKLTA